MWKRGENMQRSIWIRVTVFVTLLVFISTFAVSSSNKVAAGHKGYDENPGMQSVAILNYHMVGDLNAALCISAESFDQQMKYLYGSGDTTITPDQLIAHLRYGKSLPEKPVMITFDDGYLDNYTLAYPILKKYGQRAVFFLITGSIGVDKRFMNWRQAKEMSDGGMIMQSHTVNHVNLTKIPPEEAYQELVESRRVLEQELGKPVRYIAYPTGAVDKNTAQLVKAAGYRAAFSVRFGEASSSSDFYSIERIPIFRSAKTFRSFFLRLNAAPLLERFGLVRQ
jgi:peptidoglycan/xylan/chitin deacetylase (PgdA/CDA1 family)